MVYARRLRGAHHREPARELDNGSLARPRPLTARMLAGALVESMRWWQDHPSAATPADMDAAVHEIAGGMLRAGARPSSRV